MQEPTISVRGVGNVSMPPDVTVISFELSALNYVYTRAVEELNERVANLRKEINAVGVDPTRLKTTSFGVQAKHVYEHDRHVFKGWFAEHRMRLELGVDRDLLNRALQAVATGRSEAKFRIGFEVHDKAAAREAVLADATRTARRNADAIASAAGCRLGKVLRVEYGWSEIRFRSLDYEISREARGVDAAMAAPDIEPEDIEAQDTVTVVWELTQG
jgi:uncharacterized protein YggE